jgi:tetratricopeptide (TPR) repeat protein
MPRNAARAGTPLAFFLAVILSLGGLQAGFQRVFEARYPSRSIENLLYLPTGENLKVMSLGFRSLLADALWVKAIGYFGGHNLTDREYPWLHHILDTVTTLDPLFRHPYLFGGIVLGVEGGDPAKSIQLLRKGMAYYPGDWRLPFYIGFNYFYFFKDPEAAAAYLKVAATLPAHPEYLPRLAASLLTKAGHLEAAIAFLETIAENTRDERVRQGLYEKIEKLRRGEIPESLEGLISTGK